MADYRLLKDVWLDDEVKPAGSVCKIADKELAESLVSRGSVVLESDYEEPQAPEKFVDESAVTIEEFTFSEVVFKHLLGVEGDVYTADDEVIDSEAFVTARQASVQEATQANEAEEAAVAAETTQDSEGAATDSTAPLEPTVNGEAGLVVPETQPQADPAVNVQPTQADIDAAIQSA